MIKPSSGLLTAENIIPAALLLLGLSGVLTIASSQSGAEQPLYLVMRQLTFLVFGMSLFFILSGIRFRTMTRISPLLFGLFWGLLLLLPFFGTKINGMRGWFKLGSFSFQPSEAGRPFFLLALVVILCAVQPGIKRFLLSGLLTFFWLLPIAVQPDFGMILGYAVTFFILLYLSGIQWKYLTMLGTGAVCSALFILWRYPYVAKRFTGFLFPEQDPLGSGWHIRQFQFAVARGGWTGSKIGGAVWSNAYLPYSYNDSAGAALLETLGLLGAVIPLILFCLLLLALYTLAQKEDLRDSAKLFIAGTAVFFAVQMLIHMGINLALLPPSGLVLPFISYGGSSLAGFCMMAGMALSASKDKQSTDF